MCGHDLRRLPAANIGAGGDRVGSEATLREQLDDASEPLGAFLLQRPLRIVGPARVAMLVGPGVADDVDVHWICPWQFVGWGDAPPEARKGSCHESFGRTAW